MKLIYSSYGMAALPMFLIKGQRSLEDERYAVGRSIELVREQLRSIQEKYQKSHKQVSRKDKILLNKLRKDEKELNMKSSKIESTIQQKEQKSALSWRLISKILRFLTPFRIILGIGCLAISLLIVSSIVITNVDRILNSKCGFTCGYLIEKNTLFNPLDFFLV